MADLSIEIALACHLGCGTSLGNTDQIETPRCAEDKQQSTFGSPRNLTLPDPGDLFS